MARHLGPEQYGELSYAIAFTAFFQALATLGLDGITVRDLSNRPDQTRAILGTVARLRLVASVAGWIAACGIVSFLRPDDIRTLALVALISGGLLFQSADVIDLWFQSQTRSRHAALARSVAFIVSTGIRASLIIAESSLWAFAITQIFESALTAFLLIRTFRRHSSVSNWEWQQSFALRSLRSGAPLLLSSLSIVAYLRIDQLMLKGMAGDGTLGLYSAALSFSQAWYVIPVALCASAMPALTRIYAEDRAAYYRRLQILFSGLAWMSLVIAGGMALGADWIVRNLLGPQYLAASKITQIHVFTNFFVFLGVAQTQWILSEERTNLALTKTMAGALISVLGNLILIPAYGAQGAAVASLAAHGTSAVFCNAILAPRIFRMQVQAVFMPFLWLVRSIQRRET